MAINHYTKGLAYNGVISDLKLIKKRINDLIITVEDERNCECFGCIHETDHVYDADALTDMKFVELHLRDLREAYAEIKKLSTYDD